MFALLCSTPILINLNLETVEIKISTLHYGGKKRKIVRITGMLNNMYVIC